MVAVVAQSPAVGVNVYTWVPTVVLSIVEGDQVPVIPLLEVVGKTSGIAF